MLNAQFSLSPAEGFPDMNDNIILLVDADGDSEAKVREAAAGTGAKVLFVKTSREAFKILKAEMQSLKLVVVDVDPGAHGLALLEAVSGCANRQQIVVITSLEKTYMEPIALKHGATACVGKPITVQRLNSLIKEGSKRSLTCDRWGGLVPSPGKKLNLDDCFCGICGKLHPVGSSRTSLRQTQSSRDRPK
jgi:two-component system chemotaxis response regulator CheY